MLVMVTFRDQIDETFVLSKDRILLVLELCRVIDLLLYFPSITIKLYQKRMGEKWYKLMSRGTVRHLIKTYYTFSYIIFGRYNHLQLSQY